MQTLRSKSKVNSFENGNKVKINPMFFRNHGLKIIVMEGIVKGVVPSWESKIPAVRVAFKYNPIFNQFQNNGYMKYNVLKEGGEFIALVRIHPMYLEKVK